MSRTAGGKQGGFLEDPPLQHCQLPGEAVNPVAAGRRPLCIPLASPEHSQNQWMCWINGVPAAEETCSYPLHPFLGSKTPKSRIYPTHGHWKVMVTASEPCPEQDLLCSAPCSPGGVPKSRGGSAEQGSTPGASLPALQTRRASSKHRGAAEAEIRAGI